MKRTKILLAFAAIFSFWIVSCQKEFTSEDTVVTDSTVVSKDSFYIDKIYNLFDDGNGIDTQHISYFHYDNLKRVELIGDTTIDTSGTQIFTSNFYYQGADKIPYRRVDIAKYSSDEYDSTVYHIFYDGQHRLLKDSIEHFSFSITSNPSDDYVRVIKYSYGNGEMYGEDSRAFTGSTSDVELSRDTATLNSDGDITKNKSYLFDGSTYILSGVSDFTYDTHINPFARLSLFLAYQEFPNGETLQSEYMPHKNILIQNEVGMGPFSQTYNQVNSYEYNAAGYVTKATSTKTAMSTPYEDIAIYSYKNL